jgi:uncharacterized membrane protein YhaH (DUF805 family)
MSFINSLQTCFKKYFIISGRSSRSEFCYFALFFFAVLGIIILFSYWNFTLQYSNRTEFQSKIDVSQIYFSHGKFLTPVLLGFIVLTILPFVAVTVRRLHDINRSGMWVGAVLLFTIFAPFIPFVNLLSYIANLSVLVMCFSYGNRKDNKFGKNIYTKNRFGNPIKLKGKRKR